VPPPQKIFGYAILKWHIWVNSEVQNLKYIIILEDVSPACPAALTPVVSNVLQLIRASMPFFWRHNGHLACTVPAPSINNFQSLYFWKSLT